MNNKPITEEQVAECFLTDHQIQWAGDGYFCSKCMTRFVSKNQALKEVLELTQMKDEEMPIHSGIYGDSNIKPDVRNKLRQQLRASIKKLIK